MAYTDYNRINTPAPAVSGPEYASGQLSSTINTAVDALVKQAQMRQALQQQLALEVGKAKVDAWAKMQDPIARMLTVGKLAEATGMPANNFMGGGNGIDLGQIMKGNPYADLVGGVGQSSFQPMANPTPSQPIDITSNSVTTVPSTPSMSPGSLPMSPMAQGGWTPMTGERNSFTGGVIPKTFSNIPAEMQKEQATKYASNMGSALADAKQGSIRDDNQLMMTAQSLNNLNGLHKDLSDKGFAGDVYAGMRSNSAKFIPRFGGLQKMAVPEDMQGKIGQFVSARNEAVLKMQPFFTQQFGKEGSVRIMDSLLHLAQGEIGDLSTPHAQFEGQAVGTLKSLYRIQQATQQYEKDLKESSQEVPKDENEVINQIYARMPQLTPDQESQLGSLINSTLGKGSKSSQKGGSLNPVGKNSYSMGQTINKGGKSWKVVGFDKDGEPLVE